MTTVGVVVTNLGPCGDAPRRGRQSGLSGHRRRIDHPLGSDHRARNRERHHQPLWDRRLRPSGRLRTTVASRGALSRGDGCRCGVRGSRRDVEGSMPRVTRSSPSDGLQRGRPPSQFSGRNEQIGKQVGRAWGGKHGSEERACAKPTNDRECGPQTDGGQRVDRAGTGLPALAAPWGPYAMPGGCTRPSAACTNNAVPVT